MLYLGRVLIAKCRKAFDQHLTRQLFPKPQGECRARELRRAQPLLHGRPDLRKHNDRLAAQEAREDVHALRRTFQSLCRARCSEVHAVQFGQLIDIRLWQQCCQILLPRAQCLAPARNNGERARSAVIGGCNGGMLHRAGKAVCECLLRSSGQGLHELPDRTIRTQDGKECVHLGAAASAARTKPAKSGCGWFGRDFSSGWNCEATNHG